MIKKYKFRAGDESSFLVYGVGSLPAQVLNIELLESNIDLLSRPDDHILPIMNIQDLLTRTIYKKRTRDKILSEEGIDSFHDLTMAYNLLRNKELKKPLRIRNLVEEKYSELINLEFDPNYSEPEVSDNSEEILAENLQD